MLLPCHGLTPQRCLIHGMTQAPMHAQLLVACGLWQWACSVTLSHDVSAGASLHIMPWVAVLPSKIVLLTACKDICCVCEPECVLLA